MKLFFVYTLSELLLQEIIKSQIVGEKAVVVCPSQKIKASLEANNIAAFLISPKTKTQKEKDSDFAKNFMPGCLEGNNFHKTNFPVWEGLSIDRLRFWAQDWDQIVKFISIFEPDEVVVPLDYYSPFILDHHNITAIKTHEIVDPLSREILAYLPVKRIIVSTDRERNFVGNIVGKRVEVISAGLVRNRPVVSQNRIDAFQEQYGQRPSVLVFDKQYTWLLKKCEKYSRTFVCVDSRSEELLPTYIPNAEILPLDIASLLTKDIAFIGGFNESVYWRIPDHVNVHVLDWCGMNLADTLPLPVGVVYRDING